MSNNIKTNLSKKKQFREKQKNQKGVVIWFTGLSGAGKTTIANELDNLLIANRNHSYILDGDFVREGLSSDLSFTKKDREENLRRIKHVAGLFSDAGIISLVAFISPFKDDREKIRTFLKDYYIEVYVSTPIEFAEKRDPKGFYKKARKGLIRNFTGIDSPYEEPNNPGIVLDTERYNASDYALKVFNFIKSRNYI